MAEAKRWTIHKTATVSFGAGIGLWLLGSTLEPKTAVSSIALGFWLLKNVAPLLAAMVISFFALGLKRPDRKQALFGAVGGALAGKVLEWVLSIVLVFIPILGWMVLPLSSVIGLALTSYLSAAGTMLGELKEEK